MMVCRTASVFAFGALFAAGAIGACREAAGEPDVPPLTTAKPAPAQPSPVTSTAQVVAPAVVDAGGAPSSSTSVRGAVFAAFVEGGPTKKIEGNACGRLFVIAAKGFARVGADTVNTGDVLAISHYDATDIVVGKNALAVTVQQEIADCAVLSKPAAVKTIIRAKDAPELRWANNGMHAHLDVGAAYTGKDDRSSSTLTASPELYIGRLEGTASVAEHDHPTSNEMLIAIEASGTFTIDGKESHLGSMQIVTVPKGTKHSWKPDPGSKLVAIQLYDPAGPEQRFIALAAATDAGTDASAKR